MKKIYNRFEFTFNISESTTSQILDIDKNSNSSEQVEDQLAKQIYEIIEHFKQEDPVGLPLVPLPDPTVSYQLSLLLKLFDKNSFTGCR